METSKPKQFKISTELCKQRADLLAYNLLTKTLATPNNKRQLVKVYGVPRGGLIPAYMLVDALRKQQKNHMANLRPWRDCNFEVVDSLSVADVVIDDLIDSGETRDRILDELSLKGKADVPVVALFNKILDPDYAGSWLVFPWERGEQESDESGTDIVTRLLQYIGEDPAREGLKETPARTLKAWREVSKGYHQKAKDIMKVFKDGSEHYNEMVLVGNIPFYSNCEHHMLPIIGRAHIAYIPNGKILGLSKLVRLLNVFAKRLQVQERLTTQVANALLKELEPLGVAVVLECRHMCMEMRGIATPGTITTTQSLHGVFIDKPEVRAEVMSAINNQKASRSTI